MAKRTPFVLLIVVLLGTGLISLLVLNSALNQGSFELSRLERQTTDYTDERQALQQEVDELSAPEALERRARELGMVPGGSPVFLEPDGTVRGVPAPATGRPSVARAPARSTPPALAPTPSAAGTGPRPGTGGTRAVAPSTAAHPAAPGVPSTRGQSTGGQSTPPPTKPTSTPGR